MGDVLLTAKVPNEPPAAVKMWIFGFPGACLPRSMTFRLSLMMALSVNLMGHHQKDEKWVAHLLVLHSVKHGSGSLTDYLSPNPSDTLLPSDKRHPGSYPICTSADKIRRCKGVLRSTTHVNVGEADTVMVLLCGLARVGERETDMQDAERSISIQLTKCSSFVMGRTARTEIVIYSVNTPIESY